MSDDAYLLPGLPAPVPARDGLDEPFWTGLRGEQLFIQRCQTCEEWQWGPEWVCHHCHSFDLGFEPVEPEGIIYSHQRVWHPVHSALEKQGPYIVVLVELVHAGNVRIIGNLLGDPEQDIEIGAAVVGRYEHHPDNDPPFTLLQWQMGSGLALRFAQQDAKQDLTP